MDYRDLTAKENEQTIIRVIDTLTKDLPVVGDKGKWDKGWAENLQAFKDSNYDLKALIPKFVKNEIMRFSDNYVMPLVPDLETKMVTELRKDLFGKYFKDVKAIYEFGCGTGLNLVALANMFPSKSFWGVDWSTASNNIINLIATHYKYPMIALNLNMLMPSYGFRIDSGSAMFTIGAMEQLGTNFGTFLQFILDKKFSICINIETLYELYNPNSLYDYLAMKYMEKRGYLQGYLAKLEQLEEKGKIEILELRKGFGCLYHNGYSYVVWRPKNG